MAIIKDALYRNERLDLNGKAYDVVYKISSNYFLKQSLASDQKIYVPLKVAEEYGLRLDLAGCFLCQTIAEWLDSKIDDTMPNNTMYNSESCILTPNKYPLQLGHSLIIPLNHDKLESRVIQRFDQKSSGVEDIKTIIPEDGKTWGAIIEPEYISEVIRICDQFNFVGIRNHVMEGMSIIYHDHFHVLPEDLPSVSLIETVIGKKEATEYGKNIFRPQNTPFDTIFIEREGMDDFPWFICSVLKKMEANNQVFTLVYHKGRLFISPRSMPKNESVRIGGGIPIHYFDQEGETFLRLVNKHVPMKGEYNWSEFIEH